MVITEFDEKSFIRGIREEGREEGIKEGIKEGLNRGHIEAIKNMISFGLSKDKILTKYSKEDYEMAYKELK